MFAFGNGGKQDCGDGMFRTLACDADKLNPRWTAILWTADIEHLSLGNMHVICRTMISYASLNC